jgi:hypothetical protein
MLNCVISRQGMYSSAPGGLPRPLPWVMRNPFSPSLDGVHKHVFMKMSSYMGAANVVAALRDRRRSGDSGPTIGFHAEAHIYWWWCAKPVHDNVCQTPSGFRYDVSAIDHLFYERPLLYRRKTGRRARESNPILSYSTRIRGVFCEIPPFAKEEGSFSCQGDIPF